jgi:hypothetical protein
VAEISKQISGVNYADRQITESPLQVQRQHQNYPSAKASTPDPALATGPNGSLDILCYVSVVAAKILKVLRSFKIDSNNTYNTVHC